MDSLGKVIHFLRQSFALMGDISGFPTSFYFVTVILLFTTITYKTKNDSQAAGGYTVAQLFSTDSLGACFLSFSFAYIQSVTPEYYMPDALL